MLTCATAADVPTIVDTSIYNDVCRRMPTYADVFRRMLTCATAADVPTIVDTSIYKHTVVENAVISCDVRYMCVLIRYYFL
jgi:hypothetical protein